MTEKKFPLVLVCRCFVVRDNGDILLIQRSEDSEYHPGAWECPGGKVDSYEDLTSALEREVLEETGLAVEVVVHPVLIANRMFDSGPFANVLYVMFFGIGMTHTEKPVAEDGEAYQWVPYYKATLESLTPETFMALLYLRKRYEQLVSGRPTKEDLARGCDCEAPYAAIGLVSVQCPVHGD